jgi:hypothetical protein
MGRATLMVYLDLNLNLTLFDSTITSCTILGTLTRAVSCWQLRSYCRNTASRPLVAGLQQLLAHNSRHLVTA